MRRALGLTASAGSHVAQQRPEQARQRHRFVQDGGVPVVMLGHKPEPETAALRERITALEAALEAERSGHAATKRVAQEHHAAAQALQTRLAHAELAHTEALDAERRLLRAAQQATLEAQAAVQAVPVVRRARPVEVMAVPVVPVQGTVEAEPVEVERLQPEAPRRAAAVPVRKAVAVAKDEKPKRGRPRVNPLPEPKPVRWWTPSFRAKSKG